MGCGGSKDVKDASDPLTFVPKDIADNRPDKIRKELTALYAVYVQNRDKVRPLLAEKYGIQAVTDEEREKLLPLSNTKEELFRRREPLLQRVWEKDVEDIQKAFSKSFSTDKSALVNIICARTYWQLAEISRLFRVS